MEAVLEHEKQTVNLTKELEDEPQRLKEEKKKVLNSRLYSLLELFQFFTKAEFSEEEGRASVSWLPLMLSRFSPLVMIKEIHCCIWLLIIKLHTNISLNLNFHASKHLRSSWMQGSVLMPSITMEIPATQSRVFQTQW